MALTSLELLSRARRHRPFAIRALLQSDLRRVEVLPPTDMTVEPAKGRENLTARAATACLESPPERNLEFHATIITPAVGHAL